ncbi:general transcription factor 3C polypeptide 4-like [Battus philenor]|uniref:general transcription factor 3C polypeptide 4-like n=1 Tax=Battus philenor TaxID=42288 RepID=UPI0035D015F2
MLHEITKLHIYTNKIENTAILCHNSAIAIRSDRGLHILDMPYDLHRYDKKLDYTETIITAPKYSPVTELFEINFVKNGVRNSEFIQMILDPTLWPHNNQLLNEMTSIATFEWSPVGLYGNMERVMAILTNVGCVELFGPSKLKWTSILNLSSLVKDNLKHLSISEALHKVPKNPKELQEAAHALATIAICWSDKINADESCYFVTAQKNGLVLFWLLTSQGKKISADVVGYIDGDLVEINYIKWVPLNNEKFLIITSNVLGKVHIHVCVIDNNSIKSLNKHELWTYSDRMIAKHFNYIVDTENIVLLYSKNRHFIVQMLDRNFILKSQEVVNINDYKITDIKKENETFYLSTINNKLFKISIQYDSILKVETSLVQIKESYPTSELHALGFSTNGILCMFALIERKILWRKEPFKIDLIILKNSNKNETEIAALLNNDTKRLTNYWDYIELIRYSVTKTKMLPNIDYKQLLDEGENDIYKLKIYYILLIFYKNLEKICKDCSTVTLPETSLEVISERIHASYARSIIKNIYEKHENNCDLEDIESETLFNAKVFLEYYCDKYEMKLSTLLDPHISEIVKNDYKYVCQCCDEEINRMSCVNGHLNMFCSLTFTPIESDNYLLCKACGALACSELLPKKPMCVFCDLYLCESILT